ncbi:MAG: hypothetical protein HRT89_13445 [Lentisphaeria bacterium]|nr:hypothetical protein [Lentisphaeria bacterium]NQZ69062.1 hypothetical protein [Lentisphaeria bacterium]
MWILAKIGGAFGNGIDVRYQSTGEWIGRVFALWFLIYFSIDFYKHGKKRRKLAALDSDSMSVQEIRVKDPEVVEIKLVNANSPIVCFDIGDDTLLYLQGQWLYAPQTYGLKEHPSKGKQQDKFLNYLPEPYCFPRTEFVLVRTINTGEVLSLSLAGQYLLPEKKVDVLKPEYDFGQSRIFKGPIDELERILQDAHDENETQS